MTKINRKKMVNKKKYCEECGNFIFKTFENGRVQFRVGTEVLLLSRDEYEVTCKCGHKTVIKFED
jgi:hypothetical protein